MTVIKRKTPHQITPELYNDAIRILGAHTLVEAAYMMNLGVSTVRAISRTNSFEDYLRTYAPVRYARMNKAAAKATAKVDAKAHAKATVQVVDVPAIAAASVPVVPPATIEEVADLVTRGILVEDMIEDILVLLGVLAQTMVKAWAPENKAGMESIREILKRYGY